LTDKTNNTTIFISCQGTKCILLIGWIIA